MSKNKNAPNILSGILCVILSGMLCESLELLSDILPGISPELLSGKSSDIMSDNLCKSPGILSDILLGISSGILSGISCGSFSAILSGISSDVLSGISPDILSGISSDILSGTSFDNLPAYLLTFGLTCFLTYPLTFGLTFFLAYLPAFSLTFFEHRHLFWHSFWQSFWHIFWPSFWHSFWHIFWHSFCHLFWHSVWYSFCLTSFPYLLTFCLTFFLAYLLAFVSQFFLASLLTVILAHLLAVFLTFFLAHLLSFFASRPTFCLTFFLAHLLTFCVASLPTFFLAHLVTYTAHTRGTRHLCTPKIHRPSISSKHLLRFVWSGAVATKILFHSSISSSCGWMRSAILRNGFPSAHAPLPNSRNDLSDEYGNLSEELSKGTSKPNTSCANLIVSSQHATPHGHDLFAMAPWKPPPVVNISAEHVSCPILLIDSMSCTCYYCIYWNLFPFFIRSIFFKISPAAWANIAVAHDKASAVLNCTESSAQQFLKAHHCTVCFKSQFDINFKHPPVQLLQLGHPLPLSAPSVTYNRRTHLTSVTSTSVGIALSLYIYKTIYTYICLCGSIYLLYLYTYLKVNAIMVDTSCLVPMLCHPALLACNRSDCSQTLLRTSMLHRKCCSVLYPPWHHLQSCATYLL